MGRPEKTVFISYRRTNVPWALAIFQNLTFHGYDVFFDYQSIDSGNFEKVILENIKTRAHFLLILTPSALDRCSEPGDWLRREIETAIDEKRNIVPLMLESFDFGSPLVKDSLTGKLALLNKFNGLRVYSEYFFEAMDKLCTRYLNVAISDIDLPALNIEAKEITEIQKTAANEAQPVAKEELTAQEWFERGYIFWNSKNFIESIRCYSEAIRLSPDDAVSYFGRGDARRDNKDLQGALEDYDEAVRLKPDYAQVRVNRGNARRTNKDLQGALEDYDEAIRLSPYDFFAYSCRGRARGENNDLQGALEDFNEAIRLQPDFAFAYRSRGDTRRNNKDLQGALEDYDEAVRLKPDYASAYFVRGITHQIMKNFGEAAKDYEEAIRLKLDNSSIRSSLMAVLRKLGRISEAEEQEKLARELLTNDNEYARACFEAIFGNVEKALGLLKIALAKKQSTKEWAQLDPDFESIRGDPRFKELVK